MPFESRNVMDQKRDFVHSFQQGEISKSELCRRYGITRKTGDKWIKRFVEQGVAGLEDLSRKPKDHPRRLSPDQEEKILRIRDENPAWGSKKIHRLLMNSYGESPARRTIDKVLKRTGRVSKQASTQATPWQRFEYEFPNELWQMDFKGHFALNNAQRCHPLTIIDDHSRYNLGLIACGNEQRDTVKNKLTRVFFQYGKPNKILADNGAPWGATGSQPEYGTRAYTVLEKWLMQHDIKLIHGRPLHPQTQGKDERFHRTLKVELLQYHTFNNLKHCQKSFDQWRLKYNYQRPHEALDFDFPSDRYQPSIRSFSDKIRPPEYPDGAVLKPVDERGKIYYKNQVIRVGKAFKHDKVALVQINKNNQYQIMYYNNQLREISL